MFKNRKRRAREHVRLVFEVLENRELLAALPVPVGMSSHEFGHAGHSLADHDSRPADFRTAAMRDSSRYDDRGRHVVGDVSGRLPPPGSPAARPVAFIFTTLRNEVTPPAIPDISETLIGTGGFVTPTPIAELPALNRTVDVNSSLTTRSTDLSGNVSQTDSLVEGEFAPRSEWLSDPADSSVTALSSADSGISSSEWQPQVDANAGVVFAAMADSDLLAVNLAFLDEVVEARRSAIASELGPSSATDADLDWYWPSDGLHSESTKAKEFKPFWEGFVDIGDSVDELFSEQSTTRQTGRLGRQPNASYRSNGDSPLPLVASIVEELTVFEVSEAEEGDPSEFENDSTADSTAEQGERDRVPSCDILRVHRANRLTSQAARDAETTTGEQPDQAGARDGMVQLAHGGNTHAEGLPDQAGDAYLPVDRAPSFLKVDGSVVRYQAFEVAPVPARDNSEPPTSADSDVNEQPSAGNVSSATSDRHAPKSASACLVPAILAFLWRHRSRRDVQ